MPKVSIEQLFALSENGLGQTRRQRCSYWAQAYFWAQPSLFDDLEPQTWDEILWADVVREHPQMFTDFEWPEEKPGLAGVPRRADQLPLLKEE